MIFLFSPIFNVVRVRKRYIMLKNMKGEVCLLTVNVSQHTSQKTELNFVLIESVVSANIYDTISLAGPPTRTPYQIYIR